MIKFWQKKINEDFFTNMIKVLKEGGVWIWIDMGFKYTLVKGKLVGENEKADLALKEILPEINNIT